MRAFRLRVLVCVREGVYIYIVDLRDVCACLRQSRPQFRPRFTMPCPPPITPVCVGECGCGSVGVGVGLCACVLVHVCVYVCVRVCVDVYVYIYIYTYTPTHTRTDTRTHAQVHMHSNPHLHQHSHTHIPPHQLELQGRTWHSEARAKPCSTLSQLHTHVSTVHNMHIHPLSHTLTHTPEPGDETVLYSVSNTHTRL